MRIAVLGAGVVGTTLATGLSAAGHDVALGARTADSSSLQSWRDAGGESGDFAGAIQAGGGAELVINALPGLVCLDVLKQFPEQLSGIPLWDVANPLDFSNGPAVVHPAGMSLGERIQATLPHTSVVKALNTMNTTVMTDPAVLPGASDVFLCGDDDAAKSTVVGLLGDLGWKPERIRDLGDITAARATEQYLLLWLRVMGVVQSATFNIAVVTTDG